MGNVVDWPIRAERIMRCIGCNRAMFAIARHSIPVEYHCPHMDCAEFAISWKVLADSDGEQALECIGRVLPALPVRVPTFQQMGYIG